MHCGESLSFKATAAAVVATPHFGRRQRPCSSLSCGRPSQSSYLKLRYISSRDLQQSSLPTASHIPRATKDYDDDAIAQPVTAAIGEHLYMPEEWPDFSRMKVAPNIEYEFFNRSKEYDMIMELLNGKPSKPLLLLGPINSGKSVSCCQLSVNIIHSFFVLGTLCNPLIQFNMTLLNLNHAGIIEINY